MISTREIRESLERLQNVFQGNYGPTPLCEGTRRVGSIRTEGNTLYLTFRGSVDSFSELLSCLDLRKTSAEKWGLAGRVHSGLSSAFNKVERSINNYLVKSFPQNLRGIRVVVEGYSRGSGLAMLAAAHLVHSFAAENITLITYSPLNIFNRAGAEAYKQKIGNQWNFFCINDFIPRLIGPSCLGFCPHDRIEFSSTESPSFLQRVEQKKYTHLITRPWWLVRILRWIIPLRWWESHMPETYDGAIQALHRRRA